MLFIYYIDREELYALKKSLLNESEIEKLRDWEIENKEYLIIEFINDKKLFDINELQLTFIEQNYNFYRSDNYHRVFAS